MRITRWLTLSACIAASPVSCTTGDLGDQAEEAGVDGALDSAIAETSSIDSAALDSERLDTAPASTTAATTTFPIACPPAWFAPATMSPPVVIDGKNDVVLTGIRVSNPSGDCIVIKGGSKNVRIEKSEIGPCGGSGVVVNGASDVQISNSYIHDAGGNAVTAEGSNGVSLATSCIARVATGLYALSSTAVVVERNSVLNVQGPMPRGQLVQLDKCSGAGHRIKCNLLENVSGQSNPEDGINLYKSNGTAASPIEVVGNRIRGGGPSESGGGILLGDGGGSFQVARGNIAVNPGQYGIAIASGTNMTLRDNRIFGKSQSFTNIGIYVWNQYLPEPCSQVTVSNNQVTFFNKAGMPNPYWNANNCEPSTAMSNNFDALLAEGVINDVPTDCLP